MPNTKLIWNGKETDRVYSIGYLSGEFKELPAYTIDGKEVKYNIKYADGDEQTGRIAWDGSRFRVEQVSVAPGKYGQRLMFDGIEVQSITEANFPKDTAGDFVTQHRTEIIVAGAIGAIALFALSQ